MVIPFLARRRFLLFLLGIFAAVFLSIRHVVSYAHSLQVFEFAFITLIFGFAPAFFFRKVFKFENIIGWLVNSSVLGVLFIPFLFILLGWVGINWVFIYSIIFLYGCSLLGLLLLFLFEDDLSLKNSLGLKGIGKSDIFFFAVLGGYTFILTLQNFYRVYIQWDAFTFWGLDAKYIFQMNQLRDSTLDVFGLFRYTAYYPVYYSIIYDLYGAVVEQYANWINVFLNFLAMLLVYNQIIHKGFAQKFFVVTLLVIVSYAAFLNVYMLSMYSDVLCAFTLLLFAVVLTSPYEFEHETYNKRIFLLLTAATCLYFIKSPYIFLTGFLIFVYILYDFELLQNNWRILINRTDFKVGIAIIVLMYAMRSYYFAFILEVGNTPIKDLYTPHFVSLHSSAVYGAGLAAWFFNRSPYLVGLWVVGLCSVLLIGKSGPNRSYYYIYCLSISIVLFYLAVYVINQSDLTSGSLVRYCAVVMYLIPLLFTWFHFDPPPAKLIVSTAVLFLLCGYFFTKIMTPMPMYEKFELSTGSYNVVLKKEARLAEKALRLAGNSSRILIADDVSNDILVGNMNIEAIFVRYFLMFNSVGGQYTTTADRLYEYALIQDADYILLLSYADSFDSCGKILMDGHHYLIKTEEDLPRGDGECLFSGNIIFDLSKR